MIYFNHKKCTIQMNPLSLNLFEIEILNDESLYSHVQGFFMPFSLHSLQLKKQPALGFPSRQLFYFHLFSHILKDIAEIKGSKVVLWRLRTADHPDASVLPEKKLCTL